MKIAQLENHLSLTNDKGLSVFFIGTGNAFSKIHNRTNILIIKNHDHLLIDCGTTCTQALWNLGINSRDIENIFISHSHCDHVGNLEELAFENYFTSDKKLNLIITDEYKKKLWNETLKGALGSSCDENGRLLKFDDYFNQIKPKKAGFIDRPLYEAKINSIDVKIFRTNHVPAYVASYKKAHLSYGILIDERLLFTLDTKNDPSLINSMLQKFPTIEYIFHDCQLNDNDSVHASYPELKAYPERIKNKMYLCHYSDNFDTRNPVADGFAGYALQGVYYNFYE